MSSAFHVAADIDMSRSCSLCMWWLWHSEQPCKTDADVIRALETAHISPVDYPLVHQWRNNVLSYPEDLRKGLVLRCTCRSRLLFISLYHC